MTLRNLLLSALIIIGSSPLLFSQHYCDSDPVTVHGALKTSGNKIVDQFDNPVSFAGNSFFWSNDGWGGEKYYRAETVEWLKEDWGTTIVRASMGVQENGGYLDNATGNKNKVIALVDAAIENGLYVIIDWHSHHAEDNLEEAISFFEEMANTYGTHPNVIYEIYNEPLHVSWPNVIKPYSEAVIAAIRAIDPDNLIIVGSGRWSQDVDVASNNPITDFDNIAYTLHFYAGSHGSSLRQKAQKALDNGVAIVVTEWGSVEASGDGIADLPSTDTWMLFLKQNDITHLNWAVNDKEEGASILFPGGSINGSWEQSDLTLSGQKVRFIVKGWKQYCPVEGSPSGISETEISQIKILPNPSEGNFQIANELFTGKVDANIYNNYGQLVYSKQGIDALRTIGLNTDIQSGHYFIIIRGKQGTVSKKLVVYE